MPRAWTFHAAGRVVFGCGAARDVGIELVRSGLDRVMVVSDPALFEAGILGVVERSLAAAGRVYSVFAEGEPEPDLSLAAACAEEAEAFGAQCVLGLGGGSNMDLAKVTAVVLAHGGLPADYLGDDAVPGPVLPIVAVPTTGGTGSEVSASAVLADHQAGTKVALLSNSIRPRLAIVDPELAVSCPSHVTADSGMDALTHAIEAFTAVNYEDFSQPDVGRTLYQGRNPVSDGMAEGAIRLVGQWLFKAVHDPSSIAAREGMAAAALMAGLAFSNSGVALVHAMEYPVGMGLHCSHGRGNGVLLPHVMRFNLSFCAREFARIAQLLGREVGGLTLEAAAEEAIRAVQDLGKSVGIPARLADLGATEDMIPQFAERAFAIKRVLRVNPRPTTLADIEELYRKAL